ncbi:MAG: methyltransferase domain-containing protein [Kiloniellaceae bacterium]
MQDSIATDEKVVLHVGCGPQRSAALNPAYQKPGWREIRLDIDPQTKPDVVASMTNMSAIESGSVDAVWTSHSLEHLNAHEVPMALSEFHRVLRTGGHMLARLPDIQQAAELLLRLGPNGVIYDSPSGPITPLDMIFGHIDSIRLGITSMQHKTGFTGQTLGEALTAAGFRVVKVQRKGYDLWARAQK